MMIKGKHLFLGSLIIDVIFLIILFFFHNHLDDIQSNILTISIIALSVFCIFAIPLTAFDDD